MSVPLQRSMAQAALAAAGVFALTLAAGVVVARMLGPEDRGTYGTLLLWVQVAAGLGSLSVYDAALVRLREGGAAPGGALPFLCGTGCVMTALAAAVAAASGALSIGHLLFVGAGTALAFALRALTALDLAALSFGFLNAERVATPGLFLAAALAVWALGGGLGWLLAAFLAAKLPALAVKARRARAHREMSADPDLAARTLALAPRLLLSSGAVMLAGQMPLLAAGLTWDEARLGALFVAHAACGAGLGLAMQALRLTLLPALAGRSAPERRRLTEGLFRIALILGPLGALPVAALAPWLLPLVYGAPFAEAAPLARLLAPSLALLPALTVLHEASRAAGLGRVGAEMGAAALAVWALGWAAGGYAGPPALGLAAALAAAASIAAGLAGLARRGAVSLGPALLPGPADLRRLAALLSRPFGRGAAP